MESRGQNALRSRRTGGWVYHNIMILIGRYLLFTHIHKAYLFFWDKLNKCNYYLELSIQHADLPVDDRLVSHLSDDLISDGGQWDMVVNLLEVSFFSSHYLSISLERPWRASETYFGTGLTKCLFL